MWTWDCAALYYTPGCSGQQRRAQLCAALRVHGRSGHLLPAEVRGGVMDGHDAELRRTTRGAGLWLWLCHREVPRHKDTPRKKRESTSAARARRRFRAKHLTQPGGPPRSAGCARHRRACAMTATQHGLTKEPLPDVRAFFGFSKEAGRPQRGHSHFSFLSSFQRQFREDCAV